MLVLYRTEFKTHPELNPNSNMFNPVKEVNKNVKNTIMADKCVISHEKAEERKKRRRKKSQPREGSS